MIDLFVDMWEDGWGGRLIALIILGIIAFVAALAIDFTWATSPCGQGIVIDRAFKPMETGVGNGVSSSGKSVTVITTSAEQWNVIVAYDTGGEVVVAEADKAKWVSLNKGDRVWVCERIGKLLGIRWLKHVSNQ